MKLSGWLTALVLTGAYANPVSVRHPQGFLHGFLVLKSVNGAILAAGDATQNVEGDHIKAQVIFRFRDGSLLEETTLYTQRHTYQLQSYHLIQKGRTFKTPLDLSFNVGTGHVDIHYSEKGKEKTDSEVMTIPEDVANGMVPLLLGDVNPKDGETTLSMVVSTPKPRIVKLKISPTSEDTFLVGGYKEKSVHYVIKVDIGGISGLVAPLIGKQPPPTDMWISAGTAPIFLKSSGPLYDEGPVWQVQMAGPSWPKSHSEKSKR